MYTYILHVYREHEEHKVGMFVCACDVVQAELAEDQQRYLKYFTDQLEKRKKEEEETDLLMEEALKEVWAQRDQQRRVERQARNRLMKEVMETRSLQIQHKREEMQNLIIYILISIEKTLAESWVQRQNTQKGGNHSMLIKLLALQENFIFYHFRIERMYSKPLKTGSNRC